MQVTDTDDKLDTDDKPKQEHNLCLVWGWGLSGPRKSFRFFFLSV